MAIPHSPHFRLLLAKHQPLYMLLNKTGTGKEQKVVAAYWNEAPTYRAHLFFALSLRCTDGCRVTRQTAEGRGRGEAVATLVYFQKVEDGAAAASAMVMRTPLGSIPPNERTASLRCCLVSEASSAAAAASCCEEGGEAATVERGMRRKREGWLLDTVAAAALTVSERRSGCGGRGGEPFFLSLLEIPPPSCGAHIKGEREKEKRGGIGGDTHSDICIGRERDLRSLTGMAMFDALFSQSG